MEHPEPDTQNWTWVLDRPCPQCGHAAATVARSELPARVRGDAAAWRRALGRGDLTARRPPIASGANPVWSALEYGAHVRDVLQLFEERVGRILSEDDPTFYDWDQDRAAIDGDYRAQDPGRVGYALAVSAGRLADTLDRLSASSWERMGRRSDGTGFTVESLVRYLLHDVEHHLWDVARGYEALTGSGAGGTDVASGADGGPSQDGDDW